MNRKERKDRKKSDAHEKAFPPVRGAHSDQKDALLFVFSVLCGLTDAAEPNGWSQAFIWVSA